MRVKKYYKLVRVDYEDSAYMRLKNVSNEAGIFKMVKTGSPTAPNLEYSLDGVTWTTYDFTTLPEVSVAAGANIYFRGTNANNQFNTSSSAYVTFSFNKTCEGHGNMCSLFNPDPAVFSTITSVGTYGLRGLFSGCTTLVTAPDLSSVTSVDLESMKSCFEGCTSLVTAPDLSNVTSIGSSGLAYAFYGCTSLTTAPDLSNVTSIWQYGLENAFKGCSFVTAPDLSNVTSVGTSGLSSAFKDCYKLEVATAPNVQNLTNNILYSWLQYAGSQATGTKTVRVPTGATITADSVSGIPTGWTRVDY